jgi:hypothetical protein
MNLSDTTTGIVDPALESGEMTIGKLIGLEYFQGQEKIF